jgi:hypothetical protein
MRHGTDDPGSSGALVRSRARALAASETVTRRQLANSRRAREHAENEEKALTARAKSGGHLRKIGEDLLAYTQSVTKGEQLVLEGRIALTELETALDEAENRQSLAAETRGTENESRRIAVVERLRDAETDADLAAMDREIKLLDKRQQRDATRAAYAVHMERARAEPDRAAQAAHWRKQDLWARMVVREAASGLVTTDDHHRYHAYAAVHLLAAVLEGVPNDQAMTAAITAVVDRLRIQPLTLADAHRYQRDYERLRIVKEQCDAHRRAQAESREIHERDLAKERLRVEAEQARSRVAEINRDIFGRDDYAPDA